MLYRLDAVDAYERELVKQIEVASLEVEGGHNKPFVKLISAHNRQGSITAKIEVGLLRGANVRREVMTVEDGDDLEQETGRAIYENFRIGTITCGPDNQSMEISMPGGEDTLHPGEEVGGVNPDDIKRLMIRRTIKEHLDKEMRFAAQKREVKVLTLFFIDSVEFYRSYDEDGERGEGQIRPDVRGRVPQAGEAARVSDPVRKSGPRYRRRRSPQWLFLNRQKPAVPGTVAQGKRRDRRQRDKPR